MSDDIEDIWKGAEGLDNDKNRVEKNEVKIKKKCCGKKETCCGKKKKDKEAESKAKEDKEREDIENKEKISKSYLDIKNMIPGTQRVMFKTYGCSHNTSDSEYMMGLLADYGYKLVDEFEDAHVCVINSCTVKNPSQDAFVNYVAAARNSGKRVVVAGCVPQGDRNIKGLEDCSMIGVTQIDRIVEVVEETIKGHQVRLLAKKSLPSLDLPKIRKNELIDIIPINTGCLGSCTYCKTKHARGKLGSYEVSEIVKGCLKACKEGVKEIWLTSEDTGAYGRDIGTDIPTLVMEILKVLPKEVMLRIGMTNPPYIMEHLDKIVRILNHPNVYSFIHIPVQSGSNPVLDKMNREYKVEDFNYVVDYLTRSVPNLTVATDIICGFPFETKEDFDMTLKLVEKYRFPVLNISQFYPRPGTVALKWKRVDTKEVKARSTAISNLFRSYSNYDHLKGTIQRIWIHEATDEGRKEDESFMVGHNKAYVKVLVKRDENLIGHQVIVKVTDVHKWHVYGEIVDKSPKCISVNFYDHFKGMYVEQSNEVVGNEDNYKEQINIHDLVESFEVKAKNYEKYADNRIKSNDTNKTSLVSDVNANLATLFFYFLALAFMAMGLKDLNLIGIVQGTISTYSG